MFYRLIFIFLLLIVSSFSCNFNHCAVCFQSLMNTACRSTQNAARIKRFLRLHIVINVLNKKINIISSLLRWSVTLLMFIQTLYHSSHCKFGACQKWEPAGRVGDFGNFLNGFVKSPAWVVRFWILNECNLSWKIVKYCILSEVCMIKTAPHSTVSPQMWCIKSIKGWFTRPQTCWQDFVK